jgi:hypothetical protein
MPHASSSLVTIAVFAGGTIGCIFFHERCPEDNPSLQQALTGGMLQHKGAYRFYFDKDRWEWSGEVERLHGYQPGTVNPTTELVLSHKHPEDYTPVAATLDDVRRTHKPFSTRHRIITVQGDTRDVIVIGERLHDDTGDTDTFLLGVHGAEYGDMAVYSIESPLGAAIAGARPGEHRTFRLPIGAYLASRYSRRCPTAFTPLT